MEEKLKKLLSIKNLTKIYTSDVYIKYFYFLIKETKIEISVTIDYFELCKMKVEGEKFKLDYNKMEKTLNRIEKEYEEAENQKREEIREKILNL